MHSLGTLSLGTILCDRVLIFLPLRLPLPTNFFHPLLTLVPTRLMELLLGSQPSEGEGEGQGEGCSGRGSGSTPSDGKNL